jgi:hypothetical protein
MRTRIVLGRVLTRLVQCLNAVHVGSEPDHSSTNPYHPHSLQSLLRHGQPFCHPVTYQHQNTCQTLLRPLEPGQAQGPDWTFLDFPAWLCSESQWSPLYHTQFVFWFCAPPRCQRGHCFERFPMQVGHLCHHVFTCVICTSGLQGCHA